MTERPSTCATRTGCALALALALASRPSGAQDFAPERLYATALFSGDVIEFDAAGNFLRSVVSTGLLGPAGVAFNPEGNLLVGVAGTGEILSFDSLGLPAGPPISGGGLAQAAGGLAFGPNGRLFVASSGTNQVLAFSPAGAVEESFSTPGLAFPLGIAFLPNGDLLVAGFLSDAVYEFSPTGTAVRTFTSPNLDGPTGIAVGPDSRIFVSSFESDRVIVFSPDGTPSSEIATAGLDGPFGIAVGSNDRLYVASFETHAIFVYGLDGSFLSTFTGPPLLGPQMLAFSPTRLPARLSGTLFDKGSAPVRLSVRPVPGAGPTLSLTPGLGQAMLVLPDDPADPDDLPSLLGTDRIVFYGVSASGSEKSAPFVADQNAAPEVAAGHLDLSLRGIFDPASGVFLARTARGRVSARSGGRLFVGTVRATTTP